MSFDADEYSAHDGTPQRLFLFTIGDLNLAYVQGPEPESYNGIVYQPIAHIEMPDLEQSLSEDSPTFDLTIDMDTPLVQQFIPFQPTAVTRLRVYRRHFDGDGETKTEVIGEVVSGRIDADEGRAVLSVRMLASAFGRMTPWPVFQKQCNYVTYGPGCRVDRNLFKTTTTLVTVDGNRISSPDFAARAGVEDDPEWFTLGYVVRKVDGQMRRVIRQQDDVLVLQSPFVGAEPLDEVDAFAGDNLLKSTCENKFNNLDRFVGFPWGPQKNPFTDSIMGTGTPGGATQQPRATNTTTRV